MTFSTVSDRRLGRAALVLALAMLLFLSLASCGRSFSVDSIEVTCSADKQDYYLREPVIIGGTFVTDGEPVENGLVALEIRNPASQFFAYRTVLIGSPAESYVVTIVEATIADTYGNPISAVKVNTVIRLDLRVRNNLWNSINVWIAGSVYDNSLIPMQSAMWYTTIAAQDTVTATAWVYIPEWAKPGKAMISSNVFSQIVSEGGTPYTPERLDYFDIVLNDQLPPPYSPLPTSYQTQPGQYEIYLKTSPDRFSPPGTFEIFVEGRISVTSRSQTTANFNVLDYPSPPQASFTYYPAKLYENMTSTFDASSSSAEGYNDTIIRYEWTFNDPNNPEHIIKEGNYTNPPSPLATHTFPQTGVFTVDLNVTDNEGLWSTTSKPVTIYDEFGPVANFTWTPPTIFANKTIAMFNASLSITGWSAQTKQFSPIVQYTWNFNDGTGNITTSQSTTNHSFTETGNFTAQLTVIDAVGRTNTTSKTLEVLYYAFKWDVTGDGYVGIDDIFEIALRFGLEEGDLGWDPIYDITEDGYIGIDDVFEVALHFGEEAS